MILCVRAKIDAEQDAGRLAEMGLAAAPAPVMQIVHHKPPTLHNTQFQAVIYTSRYAVAAADIGLSKTAYCVGAGSARVARDAGFSHVIAGDADAARLAEIIQAEAAAEEGAFYWPHGEVVQFDIGKALRDAGYQVEDTAIYKLVPVQQIPPSIATEADCRKVRAIMCFSAQHLDQFARLLEQAGLWHHHERWVLIVPNQRVADAVSAQWARIVVASSPSHQAMLEAAKIWAKSNLS